MQQKADTTSFKMQKSITLGRNSHFDVIKEKCQFRKTNEQPPNIVQKHFPSELS